MAFRIDVILRAGDVRISLGGRTVLDRVSLAVAPQEIVAVQGASGSGKTTLLRVLAGIQPPDSGTVTFDDDELTAMSDTQRSGAPDVTDYTLCPGGSYDGGVSSKGGRS